MPKKIFVTIFILLFSPYFISLFYILINATTDTRQTSDVILVLGAKTYKNQGYNPCLVGRVNHAVALYKAGLAKQLLFSGGTDTEDGANESEAMRSMALALGVPDTAIRLEPKSTSTYENLLYSHQLIGSSSAILVTDVFHSPRAHLVATKLGITHTLSPAVQSSCWQKWHYFQRPILKEPLVLLYYTFTQQL